MKLGQTWRRLWVLLLLLKRRKCFATMTKAERGQAGERNAELHLRTKGFRVLNRNWRKGRDEIDLVCLHEGTLVFVEVRTREESALISGYHSVGYKKKRALLRVCKAYLTSHRRQSAHYRFDLVEVRWKKKVKATCLHYENVALFTDHSH